MLVQAIADQKRARQVVERLNELVATTGGVSATCRKIGISRGTMYLVLKGKKEFKPGSLHRIANALGVSKDFFIISIDKTSGDHYTNEEKLLISCFRQAPHETREQVVALLTR